MRSPKVKVKILLFMTVMALLTLGLLGVALFTLDPVLAPVCCGLSVFSAAAFFGVFSGRKSKIN